MKIFSRLVALVEPVMVPDAGAPPAWWWARGPQDFILRGPASARPQVA